MACLDLKMLAVWALVIVMVLVGVKWVMKGCDQPSQPTVASVASHENYTSAEGATYMLYSSGKCPFSYRAYDDTNIDLPAGRDRCLDRCGRDRDFDFANYEFYCPHNCRQYGVSLCDQGKMM